MVVVIGVGLGLRLVVVHEIGLGVFPVLLLGVLVDLVVGVRMDIGMNVGWV